MPRPPEPDPQEVTELIEQFQGYPDQQYAEALADNVMDPDPVETAAFRSEQLAQRSLVAARYLIDNVNNQLRRKEGESGKAWAARAEHYRTRIGMERRLLETIVAGLRARAGIVPNAPNPRGRAMRELARRHPQEYLALVREEQERDQERARAAKEERKRLRKEAKARERGEGA